MWRRTPKSDSLEEPGYSLDDVHVPAVPETPHSRVLARASLSLSCCRGHCSNRARRCKRSSTPAIHCWGVDLAAHFEGFISCHRGPTLPLWS